MYAYWGGDGFSKEFWTNLPVSGELAVTLKFEPIPMDAESFDFYEMPAKKSEGWNIYGVRLDGKKPEIGIPEKLLNQQLDYSQPLPDPDLKRKDGDPRTYIGLQSGIRNYSEFQLQ